MLLPSQARDGYFAVRAFNAQTAVVADQVILNTVWRQQFIVSRLDMSFCELFLV